MRKVCIKPGMVQVVVMDLDRGSLARIDRRVLSGLSHDESCQIGPGAGLRGHVVDVEAVLRHHRDLGGARHHRSRRARAGINRR